MATKKTNEDERPKVVSLKETAKLAESISKAVGIIHISFSDESDGEVTMSAVTRGCCLSCLVEAFTKTLERDPMFKKVAMVSVLAMMDKLGLAKVVPIEKLDEVKREIDEVIKKNEDKEFGKAPFTGGKGGMA